MTLSLPKYALKGSDVRRILADHTCSWTWSMIFDFDAYEEGRSGFFIALHKGHPLFEVADQVRHHLPLGLSQAVQKAKHWRSLEKTWVGEVARIELSDLEASAADRNFWRMVHEHYLEDWEEAEEDGSP